MTSHYVANIAKYTSAANAALAVQNKQFLVKTSTRCLEQIKE